MLGWRFGGVIAQIQRLDFAVLLCQGKHEIPVWNKLVGRGRFDIQVKRILDHGNCFEDAVGLWIELQVDGNSRLPGCFWENERAAAYEIYRARTASMNAGFLH